MHYSAKHYAFAFTGLASSAKTEDDKERLVKRFWAAAEKNGDLGKRGKIVAETERILREMDGRNLWVIETARKLGTPAKEILSDVAHVHDIIEERIVPDLVAGVRITKNGEEQLDATLKSRIDHLFQR